MSYESSVRIFGVPYDGNSSFLKGPSLAPTRIRLMERDGSANTFSEDGVNILADKCYHDKGDIDVIGMNPMNAYFKIKQTISDALINDDKIVCLGGDHSVSFPIIEAYSYKFSDLNILHFDAHADLYDDFDGNPFSHASPFARIMEKGKVSSLTQVGIRTLNLHQRQQADKFKVRIVEMKDFNFDFLHELKAPLYISIDLDVLDPAFAPGVSHHEPGGMTTRQLIQAIQGIQVPIVGCDIVEYNPTRDLNNMTAMVGYKILKELISKMI